MHSPAADPGPSRLGVVNLEALALEPPMYSAAQCCLDPVTFSRLVRLVP
jgi:hypothetical protein